MSRKRASARDRILDVAIRLFYAEGIRAVGIDRIIAEADVAKMSFYNNFDSKDELILSFIKKRDEAWRAWFVSELEKRKKDGVFAIFDALEVRFRQKDFRGCAFINTMVEVADFKSEIHQAALGHKQQVIEILKGWLKEHDTKGDLDEMAYQLMMLIDGAIVAAVRDGSIKSIESAKAIAGALLRPARKGA